MSDTPTTGTTKAARYGTRQPKVPPFARFKGTSAWKKDRRRAREYARFRAAAEQIAESATAHA